MNKKGETKEKDKNKDNIKKEQESNEKVKNNRKKSKSKLKSKKQINPINNNENIIIINEPKEIIELREEIRKKEKKLKKMNPQHFEFLSNLAQSEINFRVDNTFEIFNSIFGYICLVYAFKFENKYNSIATYNIIDCKTMCIIKNVHKEDITMKLHNLQD